jgi:hypothetical protein
MIVASLAALSPMGAFAREKVGFSDVAGKSSLVYPSGPNITVTNPQAIADVEVWVIRELDGAIVRKYSAGGQRIWKCSVVVTPPSDVNDPLPTLIQGKNTELAYRLFLIGPEQEVVETMVFTVRLSNPYNAPTRMLGSDEPNKEYAFAVSGKLAAIKDNQIWVTGWEGASMVRAVPTEETKVSKAGWASYAKVWDWSEVKEKVKVGDEVTLLYTKEGATRQAHQLIVPVSFSPNAAPRADPLAELHFQVGTVVSATQESSAGDVVVKIQSSTTSWRIPEKTRVMRGIAQGSRLEISPKRLIAVGAHELKPGRVIAEYVLLLKDLTEKATQ